jgi:hypothetical protein
MYTQFFSISEASASAFPANDRSIFTLFNDVDIAVKRLQSEGSPEIATRLYLLGLDRIRREQHLLSECHPETINQVMFRDSSALPAGRIAEALFTNAKELSDISPLVYCFGKGSLGNLLAGLEVAEIPPQSPAAKLFNRQGILRHQPTVEEIRLELVRFVGDAAGQHRLISMFVF